MPNSGFQKTLVIHIVNALPKIKWPVLCRDSMMVKSTTDYPGICIWPRSLAWWWMMLLAFLGITVIEVEAQPPNAKMNSLCILKTGAVGDGATMNTRALQTAIDQMADQGGGTVVVPPGQFLTGAIFLKPGVNLNLETNAVLLGSTNISDYPTMLTRIEGHTQMWRPALLNADKCDHLEITGNGTIQGGGKPFWNAFWQHYQADKTTKNLDVDRPRNIFIKDSKDVLISGISLRDSGFWNLHLYRCQDLRVEQVDIRTPTHSPSTDGIDVDSCQRVTISGCYISVDDDDIAMKGTKGPLADEDKDSPPVEHIRVYGCTFGLGHGVLTFGSEACRVRDVVMENCRVEGVWAKDCLARLKLRPDTEQFYQNIHFRNITLSGKAALVSIEPWMQGFDLKGLTAPAQCVENVTFENIQGEASSFGRIDGPAKSVVRGITFKDVDLNLANTNILMQKVRDLKVENVHINGLLLTSNWGSPAGQPAKVESRNAN